MLTFLNSAILFGLAAVAIPIIIHLFTRKKTKTIFFSSLKFLKELQKQKIRRLKIRQILLLILRTLLILILIFAFARPTLRSSGSSSLESGAQLTTVIILDNTLSMGRESEGQQGPRYRHAFGALSQPRALSSSGPHWGCGKGGGGLPTTNTQYRM